MLSPIEQSIKRKIEQAGTPLRDWNISIYRGVLTGCNEAFIIPTTKRDEILNACANDDERRRTAEIIRPILRGRDIKRYGYEWAGLWVILAYNGSYKVLPSQYPTIFNYLSQFEVKLKKRGQCRYTASKKERIGADYPGQHHWLELDNNPTLEKLDDFNKPKIIYPNMTKYLPFVYDCNKYTTNQKCFIITGESTAYLTAFFNSSIFKFCFRNSFPELLGGTRELSKIFFDKIPVKHISVAQEQQFVRAVEEIQADYSIERAKRIDTMLFDLYGLTAEERACVGYIEIK